MATESTPRRRFEPRSEIIDQELRGIMVPASGQGQGPFILWDISDNGVRLWVPNATPIGEMVRLTFARPFVLVLNAEVRWCDAVADGRGFQIGCQVLDNFSRLEALHAASEQVDASAAAAGP